MLCRYGSSKSALPHAGLGFFGDVWGVVVFQPQFALRLQTASPQIAPQTLPTTTRSQAGRFRAAVRWTEGVGSG